MDLLDAALARVIGPDPQSSIDEALTLFEEHTNAFASGLFAERAGWLELIAIRGVAQAGIDRVRALWTAERSRFRDDRPAHGENWCAWPIRARSRLGLVYLESKQPLRVPLVREAVEQLGRLLAAALVAVTPGSSANADATIDSYLEATPAAVVERRQLMALLNRNEWNLSRVARLLGVTRVTVYSRMRRLGIERVKVSKTRPYVV